ncbi:structural maintenance of chromosome protein [Plasmodium gonderi]|uniref:Structural maintenance of chromosome protein n=1 Tax=Plasmodium gonderi TaxID=77519 RepID=A0A1Y1JLY2_PLAGO|nr:structural maintenance of chromosome protein [Plasmodium gonderi]GAW81074.1 structural maintenance of chromosome protein [Plasmodium gonderi]
MVKMGKMQKIQMKKKVNDSNSRNDLDEEENFESSLESDKDENEGSNNLVTNSAKVDDQDFNNFLNEEYLEGSDESSFNFSSTKPINLDFGKEGKKKYTVLKGLVHSDDAKRGVMRAVKEGVMEGENMGKCATLVSGIKYPQPNLEKSVALDSGTHNNDTCPFQKQLDMNKQNRFEGREANGRSEVEEGSSSETDDKTEKEASGRDVAGDVSVEVTSSRDIVPLRISQLERENNGKIEELEFPNEYLNSSSLASSMVYRESELCFIKYLIVCNFKSYENENVIGPFSKFTAIIGPNGSGKSNIMDCICFVLGIHNKHLRVKNMKHLIHHKENEKMEMLNKRKCYVKLVLECNKQNIEIKRTLNYRGVSNYYINERLVEHKEYVNFLKKNRIETKTKTCLIFQGDIEDVINKKPTELSRLFEYISGSDEYEQVYEDMKEKLKEKQMNCKNYLNEKKKLEQEIKIHKMQINDNIEQNLLKEEYENDVKLFYLFRLYHYYKKKEKLKDDLLTFKDEKIEFEQEILTKNKKIANDLEKNKLVKKKNLLKLQDQIKDYRVEMNQLKISLNEINEKKKFCEESLNKILANQKLKKNMQIHCTKFVDNLNEQIKDQNKKLSTEYVNKLNIILKFVDKYDLVKAYLKDRHKSVYDGLMKAEKKLKTMKILDSNNNNSDTKINQKNEQEAMFEICNALQVIENLTEYKKCKEKYLYQCANSNININNYTTLSNSLKKDIKELQEECDNLSRKKQKEVLDYESEKMTLDELTDRINKLNNVIAEDKMKVEKYKNDLKSYNFTITKKEKHIEQLDEQINVLNIHKNELIYFEKKKEIIRNLKNMFGDDEIYDEISNLYEVNNQIYYTAVNNVIHKYNNFLVVKNIETCVKCIKYLKDNKHHKMDFIPLENFVNNMKLKKWKNKDREGEEAAYVEGQQKKMYNTGSRDEQHEKNNSDNLTNNEFMEEYGYHHHMIGKVMNLFKKKNIVLANNCLVCDEQFKVIFDYLIGKNTLIVDCIKDAEDIRKKFPNLNANIVTLNGHIISKSNNLIVDISSKYGDNEKYNMGRLNISLYNKILSEKEECRNDINDCNKKIIETNEHVNKINYEHELNKKKIASLSIKKNIFEKEVEGKLAIIENYEERINKIKKLHIKKKIDTLENYESELMKERNGLASFQKESFKILNERFKIENIYESVERSTKEMEKVDEHIDRIKNNIKKLNDDINELLDKQNEINLFQKNEKSENQEENVKMDLYNLNEEEKKQVEKINQIQNSIQELENEQGTYHKNLATINQELNELRENINTNFEKYENIQSKIDNCRKKIRIYATLVKDLISECDMNGVNIFVTTNVIGDGECDMHRQDNRGGRNCRSGRSRRGRKTDKQSGRKSKLLQCSDDEDTHGSSDRSSSDRSSSDKGSSDRGSSDAEVELTMSNISFDSVPEELKQMEGDKEINNEKEKMEKEIERKRKLLKLRNVNNSAEKEYETLVDKLRVVDSSLSNERKECNLFERNFRILQKKRSYKFLHCFNYIKNVIDNVYNNLTYSVKHHVGGQAFLDLFNHNEFNKDDEPFYCGIRYNNMPPMKRFFDISELSGGEKSISALALIFSIQKYISNSFIILDEVDANMDPIKMNSLARYLNSINSQVIVISLKEKFFSKSQTLIGVYKNKHKKCSRTITLDISKYRQDGEIKR